MSKPKKQPKTKTVRVRTAVRAANVATEVQELKWALDRCNAEVRSWGQDDFPWMDRLEVFGIFY